MIYLIIDTFNGQGYSDSGVIEYMTLTDMSEEQAKYAALQKARHEFAERYLTHADDQEVKVTFEQNAIHADMGDDQGSIHFIKMEEDSYGLLIRPDINEAVLLNQEDFISHYDSMLDAMQGDRDERVQFIDELFELGNGQAHTDLGFEILYKL